MLLRLYTKIYYKIWVCFMKIGRKWSEQNPELSIFEYKLWYYPMYILCHFPAPYEFSKIEE